MWLLQKKFACEIYTYIYIYTITRNHCSLGFFSTLIKHNKDKKQNLQKKKKLKELENKKPIRCIEVIMKLTKIKEKKNQHDLEIIGQYRNWWLFSVVERKKRF